LAIRNRSHDWPARPQGVWDCLVWPRTFVADFDQPPLSLAQILVLFPKQQFIGDI
jgi:hypothetical protein